MRASYYSCEDFHLDEQTRRLFQSINQKILHFLHRLKENNKEMFEKLAEYYNFTITDKQLSINYATHTEDYIVFVFSLLRIPEAIKQELSLDVNPLKKLRAIKQFLDRTRPYSDPIYVINYCPDIETRKVIHRYALFAVFSILVYSIIMVHFNISFIF